jgi:hypothetical protein
VINVFNPAGPTDPVLPTTLPTCVLVTDIGNKAFCKFVLNCTVLFFVFLNEKAFDLDIYLLLYN